MNIKLAVTAVTAAVVGAFSFGVNAVQETQTIQMAANIKAPNASMVISPTAGSWPTQAQNISWNGSVFTNPAPIGFTVKSTNDVTLALTSTAALVDGQAQIPLAVAVKGTSSNATSVPTLSMTPSKIYDATTNVSSAVSTYTLGITATTTGMVGADGSAVSAPAPGNYTGNVSLVFESNP
ncbi:hypothetical protein R2B70_14030 [Aeromonas sp. XH]|uniref:hypothetical protein n=1 Tax=Aeromonas sp. XH TaxID=3081770 RepID=UPI0029663BEF|nr:hypothetical protein [Aeromonas sp. XH]WOX47324.1 hypothetical protein R2B70_14030 [Aeromonas sp. XH]